MSSKTKREKAAFNKAKGSLENTISRLNQCDSYERLQEIKSSIEKAKKIAQSPYTPSGLTPYHQSEINRMKETIATLVEVKTKAFPKPVQPVEVIAKEQESAPVSPLKDSAPVIKSLDPTESVPVEETKKSSDQSKDSNRRYKDIDPVRENELSNVIIQLEKLDLKVKELFRKSIAYSVEDNPEQAALYRKTAKAGEKIFNKIIEICRNYADKTIDLDTFKQQSTDYLKKENPYVTQLKTHRGCKDVIANLLIALTGVGLVAIAAVSVYHGRFTLFNVTNTDSGNKIDALTDSLQNVKSSPSPK